MKNLIIQRTYLKKSFKHVGTTSAK